MPPLCRSANRRSSTALVVRSVLGVVLLGFGLRAARAAAQSSEARATARSVAVLPVLLDAPASRFPEGARAAGVTEAVVGLRVTLDDQGRVIAADIVEPAGHGFDEAAENAAFEHRFAPARLDGKAIGARILLRVEFRERASAEGPPSVAPPTAAPPLLRPARLSQHLDGGCLRRE